MAFSRRLGVLAIVGTSWLVAIGCDDSDDKVPQQSAAGEGGEAPTAGKASVAGSQNNGGKAGGGAGTAGTAGTAGGTKGTAGGGGDAGNGESGAGQAGTGTDTAGAAGVGGVTGGAGGEGGSPATAVAASCSFACANDDDCLIGQSDIQKCNPVSHECEDPDNACTADVDCLISQSIWFVTCDDDDGCDPDYERCVEAAGTGYCATLPDPDCFGGVPRMLPRFGTAGTVEVCASADPRCRGGTCAHGCGENGCEDGNGATCSETTGLCECTQGTECTKTGVCGSDGHCQECTIDDDCAATVGTTGLGICVDGKCGCADATTCKNPYASATATCQ